MNNVKWKVLIVDDDVRLRTLLDRYLGEHGFNVQAVADTTAMDRLLSREHFDLLVLDVMLPGEDGLECCRRLREADNSIPVIMLTAKGGDADRIVGLDVGADDYVAKPFNPRELLARMHAILRRAVPSGPAGAPEPNKPSIKFGTYQLDLDTRILTRDGTQVALTTGEFALLKVLALHPHAPLSRDKLMALTKGKEHDVFDRSIDVQISRLRRLLEADPSNPRYIQTVWGHGYVFVPGD
jgi:two-component system, OmpR family, phosphate regulon response regulator OmpR